MEHVRTRISQRHLTHMKLPRLVFSMTMYRKNPKECNRKCSLAYLITPACQKYGRVGHIHRYVYKENDTLQYIFQ